MGLSHSLKNFNDFILHSPRRHRRYLVAVIAHFFLLVFLPVDVGAGAPGGGGHDGGGVAGGGRGAERAEELRVRVADLHQVLASGICAGRGMHNRN